MSTFKVEKTKISTVWNHPNADRLDLAKVEGIDIQFVVGRDQYTIGSDVVYFPIDSILQDDLITFLGLTGKLSGKNKNRIRTIKIRDEISQGFVCDYSKIMDFINSNKLELKYIGEDFDLTETLGVIKYEPEEIPCYCGSLVPLPTGVPVYDIESVEKYQNAVDILMNTPCYISEKCEGSNWSLTIDDRDVIHVCQRNYEIKENDSGEHMFWKVARRDGWIDMIKTLKADLNAKQVTLRGEFLGGGVQGNYYELKDHKVLLFDAMIDFKYMDAKCFLHTFPQHKCVPTLAFEMTLKDWLNGASIADASNGKSKLIDKLREGIVVKPIVEMSDPKLHRVIFKKRSPEYLNLTGN